MTKVFFILLGLLAASGLALAATTSRQFSVVGRAAPADDSRFIMSNDFPKEKIAKVEADFVAGTIKAPDVIKLPAAYTKELTTNNLRPTTSRVRLSAGNVLLDTVFSDQYCPYNKGAFGNDPQCGGGTWDKSDHAQCTNSAPLSYYTTCNYGNAPNVPGHYDTLSPEHPTPICSKISTEGTCCKDTPSGPCGVVRRTYNPCLGDPCCILLPLSCEQCCAGSAWLYDTATGGCSCGVGP